MVVAKTKMAEQSSEMPSNIDHQQDYGKTSNTVNGNKESNSYGVPNLGRQSSIYSLTLDEFQHSVCENGKNFGSMNMDEFLISIWTAEENQAHPIPAPSTSRGIIAKQPSLARQGSLTLPPPLCSKTVDEVWTEIQRTHHQNQQPASSNPHSDSTQHQATSFGEMTLEDFLVKAGVVREQCGPGPPQHHQSFGFTARPILGGDASGFAGNNGYPAAAIPSPLACFGGRVTNCVAPVSPVSPEGIYGPEQVDNSAAQYGLDIAALRGRKRIIDGPVEKVVERRQRRMIKNRESAARSRARKQAYTVELEAELNQLREENTQLKHALAEMERQRKQQQQSTEVQNQVPGSRAERALHKLKAMRRNQSCTL